MCEFVQAGLSGDYPKARKLNRQLLGLHQTLFVEANPIPCKWLLYDMGLIPEGIRLPLTTLSPQYHQTVRDALVLAGEEK